jgi:hypothetical protein
MIAKPIAACAAIILSFGAANAGPCDDQTTGSSRVNRAAQERQQAERAQGLSGAGTDRRNDGSAPWFWGDGHRSVIDYAAARRNSSKDTD